MKKLVSLFAITALVLAFAMPAHAAEDKAKQAFAIGIVDMSDIWQKSTAAQGVLQEMENKRKAFQKEVSQEENALKKMDADAHANKDKMTRDEYMAKGKEFQQRLIALEKKVQEHKRVHDGALARTMANLRREANKIIADVAREKDLDVVMTSEAVILAETSFDITDEVVARLNKNVKSIKIEWTAPKKK